MKKNKILEELLHLKRSGISDLEFWKRIIHSPEYQKTWQETQSRGYDEIKKWTRILLLLNKIAPNSKEVLPTFTLVLQNEKGFSQRRKISLLGLGLLGQQAKRAAPLLIKTLKELCKANTYNEGKLKNYAIWALGEMGSEGKKAMPLLLDLLWFDILTSSDTIWEGEYMICFEGGSQENESNTNRITNDIILDDNFINQMGIEFLEKPFDPRAASPHREILEKSIIKIGYAALPYLILASNSPKFKKLEKGSESLRPKKAISVLKKLIKEIKNLPKE